MVFNPDASKQAQILFSRKKTLILLWFSTITLCLKMNSHEHLGVMLDLKLTLEEHLLNVFKKVKVHYQ